uniref:Neighbor of COX4 n=1 Tax=Caligus clemensi TaxID=344056 RepID=C1C268_CALCM|nr:Neighbor of COX4 [Caligus clemensi]
MDSLPRVEFSSRAFSKIICHAAKYPSCAVNGLLLSSRIPSDPMVITDAVPLFHISLGLSPMLEVALAQIEARYANDKDWVIIGIYHANELSNNTGVDVFNQRIADKVSEHCPHPGLLVTVDNARLSSDMKRGKDSLILRQAESNGKWRLADEEDDVLLEDGGSECVAHLLSKKTHASLVDFDNHLDNITQDYFNAAFNQAVEDFMCRISKDD